MSAHTIFEIGENIKKLREFRGYSQEFMAKELKISQKTYSNIKNDSGKISKSQIEHIASILEIDPIRLLTYDDKAVFNSDYNTQAGMFNTNTYHAKSEVEKELYEKRIVELKEEVEFLRSLIKQQYDEK